MDDRGVGPVVGVMFTVPIIVIPAAVIGTLVLDPGRGVDRTGSRTGVTVLGALVAVTDTPTRTDSLVPRDRPLTAD